MYTGRYLLMGSSNWSVSTEANREMNMLLKVSDSSVGRYVEQYIGKLTEDSERVSAQLIRSQPLKTRNMIYPRSARGRN